MPAVLASSKTFAVGVPLMRAILNGLKISGELDRRDVFSLLPAICLRYFPTNKSTRSVSPRVGIRTCTFPAMAGKLLSSKSLRCASFLASGRGVRFCWVQVRHIDSDQSRVPLRHEACVRSLRRESRARETEVSVTTSLLSLFSCVFYTYA